MVAVGLVGFAGVVVFGLLYIVFFFKGTSLKLPVIGMAVFALMVAAAAILPRLEITLPEFPSIGGKPSQTERAERPSGGESQPPESAGFLRQVLLDKRGLVITATDFDETGTQGPALSVFIQNRSETDVIIQTFDASVNGCMIDASFSAAMAAGQETNVSIVFSASGIRRSGIETIAELEFFFRVLDRNRITFLESGAVTVRTPAANTSQNLFDDSGEELYSENGVRVISKGFAGKDSSSGQDLTLFIENTTDKAITVQARDVLVNGTPVDAVFSETILAGKRSAAAVAIMDTSLQNSGIGEVRDIKFRLHVVDRDRGATLFDTAPFTIVV